MGKPKRGKVATSFRSNKLTPVQSGKKFKQMRQKMKKWRRNLSDEALVNSFISRPVVSSSIPSASNNKKSKRKKNRKSSFQTPRRAVKKEVNTVLPDCQSTALLYKFRNDHVLETQNPARDDSLSVSATAPTAKSEADDKIIDTIVIEDEDEEDMDKPSPRLSLVEQVGEEMLDLVAPPETEDKSLVPNPLYEDSEGPGESTGNESVIIVDDDVVVLEEKKPSGLTRRNIDTMSNRNPGPSKVSTAPDFIPLFSFAGASKKKTNRKETIIEHVRSRARGRESYRDVARRNIPPTSDHRTPRERPIVAEGPTMMASSENRREKGSLRPIVLDGCNIAMSHGRNKTFSARGISITVEFFLRRGHQKVVAFLPQDKCRGRSAEDKKLMDDMEERGHLVYTPCRRFDNKTISSYDDTFLLDYAAQHGAVVVTRDNFRDLANQKAEWDKVIKEMILMPTFVGDDLMLPHDPQGRGGLALDEFLKF